MNCECFPTSESRVLVQRSCSGNIRMSLTLVTGPLGYSMVSVRMRVASSSFSMCRMPLFPMS